MAENNPTIEDLKAPLLAAVGAADLALATVNEILGTVEVPVVFITAYPERFLTGTRPEPAFLITKPFLTETVKAVISQALFRRPEYMT